MPGRFARHRRPRSLYDSWGDQPARSAERAAAATEDAAAGEDVIPFGRRPPGQKDRRAACKAAHGGPHARGLVRVRPRFRDLVCQWGRRWVFSGERNWAVDWLCCHEEHCQACGKVFRTMIPAQECPDYPGTPEQRAQAEEELALFRLECEQRAARRRLIRAPVTGPQGYRRRKPGKS